MQFLRSEVEDNLANMEIISSAGRREMGDMRQRSSNSRCKASWSSSGEADGASDESESFSWSMKESLSSSTPRSGEVDADVSDRLPLERSMFLERAIVDSVQW